MRLFCLRYFSAFDIVSYSLASISRKNIINVIIDKYDMGPVHICFFGVTSFAPNELTRYELSFDRKNRYDKTSIVFYCCRKSFTALKCTV